MNPCHLGIVLPRRHGFPQGFLAWNPSPTRENLSGPCCMVTGNSLQDSGWMRKGEESVFICTTSREQKEPRVVSRHPTPPRPQHPGVPENHPEEISTGLPAGPSRPPGSWRDSSRAVADWTRWLELTDTFWRLLAPGGAECRLWDWSPVFSVSQISNGLGNPNWRILGREWN